MTPALSTRREPAYRARMHDLIAPSPFALPRAPKAVVFDLDGTLIDSERLVKAAYFAQCEVFGVAFLDEQFLSLVGLHREANDARLLELFGADFPLPRFYEAITAHIGEGVAELKPGAAELIGLVAGRGLPVGLATSSGPGWVERHFSAHDLYSGFGAIVTRDDVVNRKPHPEPYLKAAGLLGVAPEDVLAIEDSPTGIRSASAAGMMAVLAPDLISPDEETRGHALCVVETLHDVVAMLEAI